MVRNVLFIHGKSCELMCNGKVGCYRISVSEKVNIPAMTEMIIEGKIADGQMLSHELFIIEPKDQSFGNNEMLVAIGLVYSSMKTPIRVMDITDDDQTLYPGTNIATISPVSSVVSVKKVEKPNNDQVCEHLQDIYLTELWLGWTINKRKKCHAYYPNTLKYFQNQTITLEGQV